jgi:hypothetical protein
MSVVSSGSLVVADVSGGGVINANNPIIGYQSLVTASNISTNAAAGFPAGNLANGSTNLRWRGLAGEQFITMAPNTGKLVDYIGVARHNFASAQIPVSRRGAE